jgi:hypothetical protein
MGKALLDVVNDFASWRGNPFTLAQLIAEKQKELIREKLIAEGMPEAAEKV